MVKALFLSLIFIAPTVWAQPLTNTHFLDSAIKNTIVLYGKVIQGQTALYNGSAYRTPTRSNEEHPFFESEDWLEGNVTYEKQFYDHIPLLYDITSDRLITENYYNASEMALVDEKLERFKIDSHEFVKLNHKTLPKAGFYELLYNGPSQAVARRQKLPQESIVAHQIEYKFDPRNKYFIYKNGAYFPVKSKRSILKVFEDEKSSLRQFIQKNKLAFKPDPTKALSQIAAQYDLLKSRP